MKSVSILLIAVLLVSGCSWFKPGCFIQDQAVSISTQVVVEQLQCANPEAVQADLKKIISGIGLCKEVQTGPIAETMCPGLSSEVVKFIASKAIPSEWACSAQEAKDKLANALNDACKKIPVKKG